jgi:hypothetical protein
MSRVVAVLEDLMRPMMLCCVGLSSPVISNRISLPATHALAAPAQSEELRDIRSTELRDILSLSNGIRLFDAESYSPRSSGCAIRLFSVKEIQAEDAEFRNIVARNKAQFASEWERCGYNSTEWEHWFTRLLPFAAWGTSGDILALDLGSSCGDGNAPVVVIDHEIYYAGPFGEEDCEDRWDSIADFLEYFGSDLVERFPSTWRYVDPASDEQFAVEEVRVGAESS